jgi:hypothetical protein
MILSKIHIKRIDDFLIRLGFEYIDIRYEMVDHIASDIESNIKNIDLFFEKKQFGGDFLRYMLNRKSKLETSYKKQVLSKSKHDYWFFLKNIIKKLTNIKTILYIVIALLFVKFSVSFNFKFTYYFMISCLFAFIIFEAYTLRQESKTLGKIKINHSYYSIVSIIAYCATQFPMPLINLFNSKNINLNYPYYLLIYLIILSLMFKTFLEHKSNIKNKYKHLFSR